METKQNSFVMIPSQVWEGIIAELKEIKEYVKNTKEQDGIGEYITEEEAKKLLGRKTTWFWAIRKDGKLPYYKVGKTNYYLRQDLMELFHINI